MTENKIDEHATLSHLGQTGKQKENGWKKKRQVLCCLIQPFLQSLQSCLGQYNQWTSKLWGLILLQWFRLVYVTIIWSYCCEGLFIEGHDQYTECGITLTSLVVETGTIWASCGLLKKIILNFTYTLWHMPLPTRMFHACWHATFQRIRRRIHKIKKPLGWDSTVILKCQND